MTRNRRRRWMLGILVLLALLLLGAVLADRALKQRRHAGLLRFVQQLIINYPSSFAVEPPLLRIHIAEADMAILTGVVETARERGVILPEGRPYVGAELESEAGRFKARVRIKGKMTDHVKGDKWSFRVVAKKDGGFLGMKRFSLQHPGTRNYLHEWLAQRLMAGEGIIALRYGFVRLELNDEDLGIYAYEEHFGPELLAHNGRAEGPLFRFDPALFWEHRLNEMRRYRFDEPYAAYQAAAVDAFGSSDLAEDSVALRHFEDAVALMEAFRRGRLPAHAVFHADLLARRHAVLDLLGGHHSMDWSDVKYYYDPVAQRIEPVAYESFSAFPIRSLAGSGRWTGDPHPGMDLHDAYFNDEQLFRAYVHHLERVSRPAYLDSALQVLGPALDSAAATVYREFPWKALDLHVLESNQRTIRRLLDVPKGFHAYLQGRSGDTLTVLAVPIEALPIAVHGIVATDGSLIEPLGAAIVPVRHPARPGDPMELRFLLADEALLPAEGELRIRYAVLGASSTKELEVFPHALLDGSDLAPFRAQAAPDLRSFPFVVVDEVQRSIVLRSGSWTLDADLDIPTGYRVEATAPLQLELRNGARITSRSPMELRGLPDLPVVITSSDNSGGGILLLDHTATSRWTHVRIGGQGRGQGAVVSAQSADLAWTDVQLAGDGLRDLLLVVRGTAHINGLHTTGGRDAVVLVHAKVVLKDALLRGVGDDGLSLRGGSLHLGAARIDAPQGVGMKLESRAGAKVEAMHVKAGGRALVVGEGSSIELRRSTLSAGKSAVDVLRAAMRYGPSTVLLEEVELTGTTETLRVGEGNHVTRNGAAVPASATPPAP